MISELSGEQQDALEKVRAWLRRGEQDIFRLYGYAGTGKTSLALRIAGLVEGTAFVAYTGKAALALRAKGCVGSTTIHRLIYRAVPQPDFTVQFVLREPEELKVGLIIVDECSMVDEELAADLLTFGRPILAMGDPHQLPPIQGRSFFQALHADVYLREVHRQAVDNPIVRASATLRAGQMLGLRDENELKVICLREATADMFVQADQIIVGRNDTREWMNRVMRRVRGFDGPYPEIGDRLVCLRSSRKRGLINGSLWEVMATEGENEDSQIEMMVQSLDEPDRLPKRIRVMKDFFDRDAKDISPEKRQHSDEFGYAYALTAHKAQGSQWQNVLVVDESSICDEPARWLYTAITRASEKATVLRHKFLVRQEFARPRGMPFLPGGQDPAVEKTIVSAFFQCGLKGYIPTFSQIMPIAAELLQLQEDRHVEAEVRVKQAALAMYDRGALEWPHGTMGSVVLHGQHLSPAFRAEIMQRWRSVELLPEVEDKAAVLPRRRSRGRMTRRRQPLDSR